MTLKEALVKLESMGDEKRRAQNAKAWAGNPAGAAKLKQFGCATGDIRALAKKIKTPRRGSRKARMGLICRRYWIASIRRWPAPRRKRSGR